MGWVIGDRYSKNQIIGNETKNIVGLLDLPNKVINFRESKENKVYKSLD